MDEALKIVCYNILDGGLGRLDPIYETLLYLEADVVGLCEADDGRGVRYLAEKLGMEHVCAEGGGGKAVAMLSKRPIERMVNLSVKHPMLDRGAMEAVVTWQGGPLRIVVTHLQSAQSKQDESKRVEQVRAVLAELDAVAMPTVWMGDMNCSAAYHPFDLAAASPKMKQRLAERGTTRPDSAAVDLLLSKGWVDAYHRLHPTQPKQTYTTGFPCSRFDYIFLDPSLAPRLVAGDVEQGGFAPYCSDHYPVWIELQ